VLDTPGPIRARFGRTGARAGPGDIRPHALCHAWASHVSMSEATLTEVARVPGNTLSVTEKTAAKHRPGGRRAAVKAAPGAGGSGEPGKGSDR